MKHSRELGWRGESCITFLVIGRAQKEGHSRWPVGARREVAGNVLAYNSSGRRHGSMEVSLVDMVGLRLSNAVSECSVHIKD